MSSKKVLVLLASLALIGSVHAGNRLINGDFESGATGWTRWWGGNTGVGVPDPLRPGNNCAGVWWSDDGIFQTVAIGPGKYVFGGEMMQENLGKNRLAIIEVNVGSNGVLWWNQQIVIDATTPPSQWVRYFDVIDNTTAGANYVQFQMFMLDQNGPHTGQGLVRYDNVFVAEEGYLNRATNPVPSDGAAVDYTAVTQLSWTNPDPNNPAHTITSDVWFSEGNSDPNFFTKIANGIAGNSVNLAAAGVTLQDNRNYYWRVDSIDPSIGKTLGDVWTFNAGDGPPAAEAGPNQYVWLNMEDGDGDPTKVTVTLAGSYVDDGKSAVTTQWSVGTTDPANPVIVIANPTASTTTATIDRMGWYQFVFTVSDAVHQSADSHYVGVYSSACAAATADPADAVLAGDITGDCKVDMNDLAILAADWIECMSTKLGCTK